VEEKAQDKLSPERGRAKEEAGEYKMVAESAQKRSFLVDLMLLRLGRWLRLLGQDVANPQNGSDEALLCQAKRENRVLITRDKRLFSSCSGEGVEGILIRSSRISEQILEMAERGISLEIDPQRCTLCNNPLMEAEGHEGELWICPNCQRLYWRGGHWRNMEGVLKNLRRREHKGEKNR